ncbi:MAG: phosphatase PAP2 family protein [Oscillospiraceae bacterium]|nr:phosphatase PAP2 family protein [Oscillospiraceae bacterium]
MIDFITKIDFSILYWIQDNLRNSFMDFVMPLFSNLQDGGLIWISIAVVMLFFKRTRYCGIAVLFAMGIDTLITEYGIKNVVCRVRPCNLVDDVNMLVEKPTSYSFPSNHSASAFAGAVAVMLTIKKKAWTIPAFVFSGIIAFSRMYVFVHFPSDVFAGILLGSTIAVLVCYLMKKTGFKALLERKNIIEKDVP